MTVKDLTETEKAIWALHSKGCPSKAIAYQLNLDVHFRTIDRYIRAIKNKLGICNDADPPKPRPPVRPVLEKVARENGVQVKDILGRTQSPKIVDVRHRAMYRARIETGRSYSEIARVFSRDHTTVIYACKRMQAREDSR